METSCKEGLIDGKQLDNPSYCSDFYKANFSESIFYENRKLFYISYWPLVGVNRAENYTKLILKGIGEWDLHICMVEKSKFSNREQFDAFFDTIHHSGKNILGKAPSIDKIAMRELLANFSIVQVDDDSQQQDIFDAEMIKVLGGPCADDETDQKTGAKICMLRDLKMVLHLYGGGYHNMTAKRGNFYFFIHIFQG